MQSPRFFRRAAVWQPASRLALAGVPEHFRTWLFDPSSLTQRVVSVCGGAFRVQLLNQTWMRPLADERRCLEMRAGALALVRQVRLMCDDQPWVYARTVMPRATLTGRERRLIRLGNRPLGAALFADPTMEREPVEIACLGAGHALYQLALRELAPRPAEIWGRRSVFRLSGKPLLVSEFFLPAIPPSPCP
jgi:chorismate--pyruvate lyase